MAWLISHECPSSCLLYVIYESYCMMLYMWNSVVTLYCYSVGKLLYGIGLSPYVVIQLVCLLYGIGLVSYVTIQSMTVHQSWVLNRVNTLWYCSDGDYSPELTL